MQGMQVESHLRARGAGLDLFLSIMLQGMQGERLQGMQGESHPRARGAGRDLFVPNGLQCRKEPSAR